MLSLLLFTTQCISSNDVPHKKEKALLSQDQKRDRFNEFYLIAHPIMANVLKADKNMPPLASQSMHEFENNMPYAFKIAGEMSEIQSQSLKPLRGLGDKLGDLVDYLQLQAKKIDLMMSYILQQQDEPAYRATAVKFGGGGAIISADNTVNIGETRIIKLFIESESAAVYCYAEAIEQEKVDDKYQIKYLFTHIRDQDQELLVRASLHLQTHALRKQQKGS